MRLKIIGAFFFCIFFLSIFSNLSFAAIASDNFEDGAWSGEPYYTAPMRYIDECPLDDHNCQENGTNTSVFSTSESNSGNYSIKGNFSVNGGAGIGFDPDDYNGSIAGTDMYLRIYVKFPSNFRFSYRFKLFRWHGWSPNLYININACTSTGMRWVGYWENESENSQYGDVGIYTDNMGFKEYVSNAMDDSAWVIPVGHSGWYYIEAHINSSTDKADIWMKRPADGSPTKVISDLDISGGFSGSGGYTDVGWFNWYAAETGGPWYFDDIAMSDAYIGPLEDGSTGYWDWGAVLSWNTWHLGSDAGIKGNKLAFKGSGANAWAVSPVVDTDRSVNYIRLGMGTIKGSAVLKIRGSSGSFEWNAGSPAWEVYAGPYNKAWQYIQVKVEVP